MLRIAFLSALVLELLATLSVALVAVTVGLRLIEGHVSLAVGLTALLLAPEAFAPLRALGAAHHAGQDATLAATEARTVLAVPPSAALGRPVGADPHGAHPDGADPRGADLTVRALAVRYPDRAGPALPATDLDARPGELVALRGASGSGKSTLLALLAGVGDPEAEVTGCVAGAPGAVAYVPQHPRTTGTTVIDELSRHAGGPDAGTLAADALRRVGVDALADRPCSTLSPGELQQVALARALVRVRRGARLLLLDEPTAHLDEVAAGRIAGVLASLRGTVTMVLVAHDPALGRLADRAVELPAGPSLAGPSLAGGPVAGGPVAGSPVAGSPLADRSTTEQASATVPPTAGPDAAAPGPATGGRPEPGSGWPRGASARAVAAGAASSLAGIALTAVSGWLIVRAAEMPPVLTLLVAIVGVRFFGLARAGLRWTERVSTHDAALRMAADLRVEVWRALAAQGLAADRTPGSALARVVGDIGVLQELSVRVRPPILVAGVVVPATVGALVLLHPGAGATVAVVLAATVALVLLAHRRLDAGAARAESALRVAELRDVATVLEGAGDLRAHGLAGRAAAELDGGSARWTVAETAARAGALGSGLVVAGSGLAAVLAVAVAGAAGLSGPVVAAIGLAPLALAEPLAGLAGALRLRGALADARSRLDAVRTAAPAVDPDDPATAPDHVAGLAVEDLRAGWPGGPDVLRGLDASVGRDGWLVVRGPSGSGKSTLLAVLMAALRPRAGRYVVDGEADGALGGIDAARLTGDDLRTRLAWLPQESHVFASSVRANLALAAPRGALAGPAGEARMRAALTAAGLTDLIAGLPHGLDSPIGAGGSALSGGERRRLAAARALLADRDVVLLDEPTAHLDPPTAAALVSDLRTALAGRVVVCVTHDDAVAAPGDGVLDLGGALATV